LNREWGTKYNFHIPQPTSDLQELSSVLRQIFGEDLLERAVANRVLQCRSPSPCVVVEGIRRKVDIGNFLALPNFFLVYVEADFDVRYLRHIARNEKPGDAQMSLEQFRQLGKAEAETQIRMLQPSAHVVIQNNGTALEFAEKLRAALSVRIQC
jgi:uridine kinase